MDATKINAMGNMVAVKKYMEADFNDGVPSVTKCGAAEMSAFKTVCSDSELQAFGDFARAKLLSICA